MRNDFQIRIIDRFRVPVALTLLFTMVALAPQTASAAAPTWTKTFAPDTIGPGSVSTLTFNIVNPDAVGRTDLAFTDTLPAGVVIATPANASQSCPGTFTTPDGGGTITLTEGDLAASGSCSFTVDVTSGTVATHENTTGDLTSSGGNSGTATDTLTVSTSLPGFIKSFSPTTVEFGGRSTLTFTIDNTANAAVVPNLDFTDTLPAGMTVANPSNKATTCGTATIPPVLTAVPGSSTITLDADGIASFPAVAAGATCTVSVDVIGGSVGRLVNSVALLADFVPAGKANAALEVVGFKGLLQLTKEFTDDPVPPGGTTTLVFTITNKSRVDAATGITFDDDLDATLSGLEAIGAVANTCGGMASSAFPTGLFVYEGGSLGPEGSCTVAIELAVPAGADPGSYPNNSGPVSGDVGGSPEIGNVANDLLFVVAYPILTKEFTDDPVGTGGTATIEFTITNTSATSILTDIEFFDELTDGSSGFPPDPTTGFLPFPVSVTLPPVPDPPCGAGSSIALDSFDTDRQRLSLTGGSLAAAGSPGDSCSFTVTVDIPDGLAAGTYTNTTEEITAVLADTAGSPTVTGPAASDDIVIVAAPQLTKEFTDDPAIPGGTAELTFTLENADDTNAATAVAFTDDLTFLTGLTAASVDFNDCAATVDIATDPTMIDVTGGTLASSSTCTITLTLAVPSGVGGTFTNTTSPVSATVAGLPATNAAARDDLVVAGVLFSKAFDNPVIPGAETTLTFTLDNVGADDATGISFTDDLAAILPGPPPDVTVVPPLPDTSSCGAGSSLIEIGGTFLSFSGGAVAAGTMCSFDVTVLVPAAADDGDYFNVTSALSYSAPGAVTGPPAVDVLEIDSVLLAMTKEFTDDPVNPGDTVTLVFTIENLSATKTVTEISFDDDLDATLSGLVATGANFNDCGGMAAGFPAGLFEYSGGTLLPGASCTISLNVDVPAGPLPGNTFPNTTTSVAGKVGLLDVVGDAASDDLLVDTVTFAKVFDGPTTATGSAVLTFTIVNLDAINDVSGIAFSDNLNAVISGLVASGLPPTPCGAGSTLTGTSFLTLTNASLPASGSCTFDVDVDVPVSATAGDFLNVTSALFSGGLPIADPASALLAIEPAPTFAKGFAPDTIVETTVSTLTFTVDNTASALAASTLDFTDNLPAGVEVATPNGASTDCTGGTLTAVAGTGTVSYTGGSVADGATCTVTVDVTAPAGTAGTKVNISGDLTSSSGNSGTAGDTLTVTPLIPPTFAKAFAPDTIVATTSSTLTFAIDNTASTLTASSLDFTDNLPAGVVVATPPGASTDCTGGTLTASSGAGTISYSGGSVADGATCTVTVDVTGTAAGSHVNTTGDLTSSSGNSGPASDTLVVGDAEVDVSVSKTDGRTSAVPGADTLVYTIVVANAGPSTDPAVAVADVFPAGLTCTSTSAASGGATGNTAAGSGNISDTLVMPAGSSVTYSASCAIAAAATGTVSNTATATASVTDTDSTNNTATDNTSLTPRADISITKTDGRTSAVPGADTLVYTIVVANAGPSTDPAVAVADVFPAGLTCTSTSAASGGATGNTAAGSGNISDTLVMPAGSSVTYSASCAIAAAATGTVSNTATATASVTDTDSTNNTATDNTSLTPRADISITKTDGRTSATSGTDTLVYTIVVANAGPSTDPAVSVVDRFAGVLTCTWTASTAGGASGSGSGSGNIIQTVSMPAGSSITYTARCSVRPTAAGNLTNTARATASVADPNPTNNTATDNNTRLTAQAPAGMIPATGADSFMLVRTALMLALAGVMLVATSSRRFRRRIIE